MLDSVYPHRARSTHYTRGPQLVVKVGPDLALAGSHNEVMRNQRVRLTEPLVREKGSLRTASWDEALDRAAAGLRAATTRNGGNGVGLFSCSKATNEMNFVAQKFMRQVLRSNNIDSCNRT
jgi:predicted molibdopterin-dependent oxidoreductase YjgC